MSIYTIAEIGINHNGSLDNCYKLIDAAVSAGCQAAKFQTFSASKLYPKSAGRLDWKKKDRTYDYDIYTAVKGFELPPQWIGKLISYCENRGIDFLSSVFDADGLKCLLDQGMKMIKLSSYTITHLPLIDACAKTGVPIFMSTGGATLSETEEAVNQIRKHHDQLKLLHCSLQYPTPLNKCHLGILDTLKLAFPGLEIGYSDHTMEVDSAPMQAIYLGGTIIEKHITLDKNMEGPDHFFALEPQELIQMTDAILQAEKAFRDDRFTIDRDIYGSSAKCCHDHEKYLRDFAFMTLFIRNAVPKGAIISPDDLIVLRPGKKPRGLAPKYISLFERNHIKAAKDLNPEDPVRWDSIFSGEL